MFLCTELHKHLCEIYIHEPISGILTLLGWSVSTLSPVLYFSNTKASDYLEVR